MGFIKKGFRNWGVGGGIREGFGKGWRGVGGRIGEGVWKGRGGVREGLGKGWGRTSLSLLQNPG